MSAERDRWRQIAQTLPGVDQCAKVIHKPDYVRSWRTWWRWRPACIEHGLTFRTAWAYEQHWEAVHRV